MAPRRCHKDHKRADTASRSAHRLCTRIPPAHTLPARPCLAARASVANGRREHLAVELRSHALDDLVIEQGVGLWLVPDEMPLAPGRWRAVIRVWALAWVPSSCACPRPLWQLLSGATGTAQACTSKPWACWHPMRAPESGPGPEFSGPWLRLRRSSRGVSTSFRCNCAGRSRRGQWSYGRRNRAVARQRLGSVSDITRAM